jgi:regulator of protease activity HflC (stomatin/prohibitin superfamily)
VIILLLVLAVAIIYFDRIFIRIKSGQQGVLWHFFTGTDLKHNYLEGLSVIFPWDEMAIYDVRNQEVADAFTVLSRDGLSILVEVSIRFHPQIERLPLLHVETGPAYVDRVVKPEVRAKIRYLIGQYLPEEIYSSQGLLVRRTVEDAAPELAKRHIALDDLLIKSITLPLKVQEAIETKLQQQQAFLEYEFRLQREAKEKDRKKIEAEGIQQFEVIIGKDGGSFDKYLTYLGVQATLALAQSNNAKVVVIGGDKGLPLILNVAESAPTPSPRLFSRTGERSSAATTPAAAAVTPIYPQLPPEIHSQIVEVPREGK